MTETFIDRWINQGVRQGMQQGVQQGEASFALRLLRQRFGSLSAETETCLKALSVEQLEKLGDALLGFQKYADLTAWLKQHSTDTPDAASRLN